MQPSEPSAHPRRGRPASRTPRLALIAAAVAATFTASCRIESHAPARSIDPAVVDEPPLAGVHTIVYHVADLDAARDWYRRALEIDPYRVDPAYVGFRLGEHELGLDPDTTARAQAGTGTIAYWSVRDIEHEVQRLIGLGATAYSPVRDAGEGRRLAVLVDPFGNAIGLVQDAAPDGAGGTS